MRIRLILTAVALMVAPALSSAQLLFKLGENGCFTADSLDYYVVSIPGMKQSELEDLLFGKMEEMRSAQPYFEYPRFIADSEGNVTFTHEDFIEYTWGRDTEWNGTLDYDYSFSIQCKDERFRIKSPRLERVCYGHSAKWYPEEWIQDRRFGKVGKRNWTDYSAEVHFNKAIAMLFACMALDEIISFDDAITLSSPDVQLFKLVQKGANTTPFFMKEADSLSVVKNYINISVPGLKKEQLIEVLYEGLHQEYRGKNTWGIENGIGKYADGVTIDSKTTIDCGTSVLDVVLQKNSYYRVDYSTVLVCSDEVIQVWAPKISWVQNMDTGKLYRNLNQFCIKEGLYTLWGTLNGTERTKRILSSFDASMNKLIWTPLYTLQQAIINPLPPTEENNDDW